MDLLLRGNSLSFSIDKISYNMDKELFSLRIIPDINSFNYLPFHLRTINVAPELVSKEFLQALSRYGYKLNSIDGPMSNSVVQGGYYQINREYVPKDIWDNLFKEETIIKRDNDIFAGAIKQSPYLESQISVDNIYSIGEGQSFLSSNESDRLKGLFLYCFNVGQGDSFLLITPNGSTYLIDTNIYSFRFNIFINKVKQVLQKHNLDERNLKALVITHKHIDHLRGASLLLDSRELEFENFLINMDYLHPTKAVHGLYISARNNIPQWINVNGRGVINEGNATIFINNPDVNTSNSINAPDINDSSIGFCVSYGDNVMYLTGDAHHSIIFDKFRRNTNTTKKECVLKVSHHGSVTGTDSNVLGLTNPSHAFISAGYNKKFKHPDSQTLSLLHSRIGNSKVSVSKIEKRTVIYVATGSNITKY